MSGYRFTVERAVLASDLPPHLRLTMLVLCTHLGKGATCWPSRDTVAREVGVRASQVSKNVTALEAAGWVLVKRGNKNRGTSRYTLLVPGSVCAPADTEDAAQGAAQDISGCAPAPLNVRSSRHGTDQEQTRDHPPPNPLPEPEGGAPVRQRRRRSRFRDTPEDHWANGGTFDGPTLTSTSPTSRRTP